ncbi:MAG: DUF58 domain-containing protein [Spirochaetes bacterium]|nr:DUF58 domain-containing protein [Spirochaetota bacterium]
MINIDPECDSVVRLFSQKNIRLQSPIMIKSENPVFKKKGSSFNLKNIREYQPFDDLRMIDWRLYARSERYFIKEFYEEENTRLSLMLDVSASMPIFSKEYYLKFVLSFIYMLLKLRFSIHIFTFTDHIQDMLLNLKGIKHFSKVIQFINKLEFEGKTSLRPAVKEVKSRFHSDTVFLFSDFFDAKTIPTRMFKKMFCIHFFKSFFEHNSQYGDVLVNDPESKKDLLIPYNKLVELNIKQKEKAFLKSLDHSNKKGYFYYRIAEKVHRVEYYWKLFEDIYG